MEDIKAIDMMNYPPQIKEDVNYNFNDYEEWRVMAKTTFKAMLPMGRFPETKEELEKHNIFGGAIALGHPTGCSGARLLVTLYHLLKRKDKELGAASLCGGGGVSCAIIIKREN